MQIYNYHSITGEYLSIDTADESPLEPGVFLIPAYATDIAPPAVNAGECAVFNSGAWQVLPDHRGETHYDAITGAPVEIMDIGQVPAGLMAAMPLSIVKVQRKAAIEAARDAACFADVAALSRTWQADKRSQELLGQAIALAGAGLPLPAVWRDAGNADMTVTALADLLAIAGAMAAQTQAAYAHSWALKAQIDAAATAAEVDAVVW